MLFNSPEYLLFLPLVAAAYFVCPGRARWVLLLAASYYFYASWDARYLALIVGATAVAYAAGLALAAGRTPRWRGVTLAVSSALLLGGLFFFKYLGFASRSVAQALAWAGFGWPTPAIDLVLPVGISFFTFQALGYVIDVYRGHRAVERHPGFFALYIAFFPQLVAGPIERASRLLPQLRARHRIEAERLSTGASLILWGLFKKVVIADRLALYVDAVYSRPDAWSGLPVIVATYFFAFQIYCDFSAYSDIAIGSARIFGIDLMQNFDRPYFARSIREFWARWHISLTTWFRDYLYIPLGGNRVSRGKHLRNLMVVFLLSGLWHGAAWTFVIWGALHGSYMLLSIGSAGWRASAVRNLGLESRPRLHAALQRVWVFHIVVVAWLFFRAADLHDVAVLVRAATDWSAGVHVAGPLPGYEVFLAVASIAALLAMHVWQRNANTADFLAQRPTALRWAIQYACIAAILLFGEFNLTEFIYFQF